jgi:Uma2 family endonuclease
MATIVLEDRIEIEIPADLRSLADFRRWALSDRFPDRGRIDYIAGRIEVDMSPEDFFSHGSVKGELYAALHGLVKRKGLGYLQIDRTRISSAEGDVSAEPDIVFISTESLSSGRVRLVPSAAGEEDRYMEVEGPVDLVVEVVSDSSVAKDTRRLPQALLRAGVREYWLADARRGQLKFQIHKRGKTAFRPVPADAEGFQRSPVFACRFRLVASRDPLGHWAFELQQE